MAEHSDTLVIVKANSNIQSDTNVCMDESGDKQNEKAMSPTLIAESTVEEIPPNLKRIIESLRRVGGSDKDGFDLLACIFYTLMIEVGFIPSHMQEVFDDGSVYFHKGRLQVCDSVTEEEWADASSNLYTFEFILQPFPERVCTMICMGTIQGLSVNLLVGKTYLGCVQFLLKTYVPEMACNDIPQKFANLDLLSDNFKMQLAYLAKDEILREEGALHAVLQDMPFEVLYKLLVMLPVKDVLHLTMTCRRLRQCLIDFEEKLWKLYFLRDYPSAKSPIDDESWRIRYREEFRNKKQKPSSRRNAPDYLM